MCVQTGKWGLWISWPTNLNQLHQVCQEKWARIPTSYCEKLEKGNPKDLTQVMQFKGNSTKNCKIVNLTKVKNEENPLVTLTLWEIILFIWTGPKQSVMMIVRRKWLSFYVCKHKISVVNENFVLAYICQSLCYLWSHFTKRFYSSRMKHEWQKKLI